ncbi:hypothetical protein ABEB36_008501 [Hypothenemus hampei]|uniref:ATP synthase subunit b n=1 Tax=Hypothenemus hampei TaxID=57062 RepID=A0ABD1EM43_HYPHA
MSLIRNALFSNNFTEKRLVRRYCDKKSINLLKTENISVEKKNDNSEECAKIERQIAKQVLIEKTQDANFRSRLSRSCKLVFHGSSSQPFVKVQSIKTNLMELGKESTDWTSYNFNHDDADKCTPKPIKINGEVRTTNITKNEDSKSFHDSDGGDGVTGKDSIQRPIRQEPGKVLLAFVPENWWSAFIPKTGITGLGTFLFTFGTFLVSKEYYVLDHDYYLGLSTIVLWASLIKYLGPTIAKYLDNDIDKYEKSWNEEREQIKEVLEESMMHEVQLQFQTEGQLMVIDAKRENVALQLEEEFRKRQMHYYDQVVKRLNYHVAVEEVKQRIVYKNLLDYVTTEVHKAITPEMQDKLIYYSIDQIMIDLQKEKDKK